MLRWTIEGMGESERMIVQAEERLNIRFPDTYRTMLTEHSGGESDELEDMLMSDEIKPLTEYPDVTCMTRWGRDNLAKVFPIFQTRSGNFYALDYSQVGEPSVIKIDKRLDENEEVVRYESFDVFFAVFVQKSCASREEEANSARLAFAR